MLLAQLEIPDFMTSSSGMLTDFVPSLARVEQAATTGMALNRLLEFAHGRMHARIALSRLGRHGATVAMAPDRAPVWPPGLTGSISHVPVDDTCGRDGLAVALAARLADCAGVGIDVERIGMLWPEHWESFLTAKEMSAIVLRPVVQRNGLALGLWSAKEAAMKALTQVLDPHDIEIRLADDGHGFSAQCHILAPASRARTAFVRGRISIVPGWVAALAML